MKKRYVVVLAAGQGTRMKSKLYKVMHPILGRPMVGHVVDAALGAKVDRVITITGFGADVIKDYLGEKSEFVYQEEQLGTAHAVEQARDLLEGQEGTTVVLSGDTPLLTAETIANLMDFHEREEAKATVLTAMADDPFGYGRVIRAEDGSVGKIVEEKDASEEERLVREINTGTYCFDNEALYEILNQVDNNNAQGEYYLPDVVEILNEKNEIVSAHTLENMDESLGVNTRVALSQATKIMRERINKQHMINGVTLIDPENTYIEMDVEIGRDTVIEPNTYLKGKTVIGEDVFVGMNTMIEDSIIEDHAEVTQSVIENSIIRSGADVGPHSHLRPKSEIGEGAHIGNYVEIKKATIGKKTKVGHHTYVGDAKVGEDVNIGCGVVFANYDGKSKSTTTVGDHSFIGSNSNLVAPVNLGDNSFVAAGSTITEEIPENALGIARARQVNKEDFYTEYFKEENK
ncbi:MAG TPA: bifunctional UDP-N-acetylglucosamine diphosphorylase/glucosamine-1-phosphate N-acetyltransferase GlmU [Candidatus Atopostipes pullistercoris]|uniref:Bifunctional protein GlmU n=1 Tax=Candidatus Atopostipes pullistercoris TaxID=2838467 RepID=A0A9D2JYZ1_9LACT|nr:bifunctional UDP-N-acetylglucosamine diphosphorylase/glucosamine-1-phosphate N-acetyltransferase GlmU [Candidatus Atopostipes pullistercoris]